VPLPKSANAGQIGSSEAKIFYAGGRREGFRSLSVEECTLHATHPIDFIRLAGGIKSAVSSNQIDRLVAERGQGNQEAREALMPVVYNDLRRLMRLHLWNERPYHTLQSAALVNEAYIRLAGQKACNGETVLISWGSGAADAAFFGRSFLHSDLPVLHDDKWRLRCWFGRDREEKTLAVRGHIRGSDNPKLSVRYGCLK